MSRLSVVLLPCCLLLAACTGEPHAISLEVRDGSGVKAVAHLQEVHGKGGRVITARAEIDDPQGRDLVVAVVEGRCTSPGRVIELLAKSDITSHFSGQSPSKVADLAGKHAIGLFAAAGLNETAPGAPIACTDL